jgi:hypothetical protein
MRAIVFGAVLLLAGCGSQPEGQKAAGASANAPASSATPARLAAAVPSPSPAVNPAALLDGPVTPAATGRWAPRDDCGDLPGAREFRLRLAEAALRGDAAAIAALAVPEVRLGFGGDDGRARFLERLQAPDGELLGELKALLALGCAADARGGMTMPWYFAQELGDVDGYSTAVVTGVDVPLRAGASAGSQVRRRLSWDMVELVGGLYPDRPFQQVRTLDGAQGYLPTERLRSLLDYRLLASRQGGQWRITAILAGD